MKPLDGKVSEEAQKVIDKAKQEASFGFELPLMNEVLTKSLKIGTLKWTNKAIRTCKYCDNKPYDYHTYPRSGRYHRKGDKNYDKPIYYSGIKFNEGFVTIQGDGDICKECADKHNIINSLIDYIIEHDLPIEIQKNDYKVTKYIKDEIEICYSCGLEMKKSEMGDLSAVMGGYYKGKCPHCGAEELFLGKKHKSTNKFVMTLNPAFGSEVVLWEIKAEIEKYNSTLSKDNNRKILLRTSSNNPNQYFVELDYSNYFDILSFNVATKKYRYKSWSESLGQQFKDVMDKFNYEQID